MKSKNLFSSTNGNLEDFSIVGGFPRREFLIRSSKAAGLTLAGVSLLGKVYAQDGCDIPSNWPTTIPSLYRERYRNWSQGINVDSLLTFEPSDEQEIANVANWCAANGYKLRAKGIMHGWSPLAITSDTVCTDNIILADTTVNLVELAFDNSNPSIPTITAQTGATMESVMTYLELNCGEGNGDAPGYGITATMAPGHVTVGGALAINAHGACIESEGGSDPEDWIYGSLSNLILNLRAIVWNDETSQYEATAFTRSANSYTGALLVHLGRAFITEVELQVVNNFNLRCQSSTSITSEELLVQMMRSPIVLPIWLFRAVA